MKNIIKNLTLIFCLCIAANAYANGGSSDYNPGSPGCSNFLGIGCSNKGSGLPNIKDLYPFIYRDLRINIKDGSAAPPTKDFGGRTYYKINQDLNEGAGGYYIYLYYARTDNAYDAISHIMLDMSGFFGFIGVSLDKDDYTKCAYKTGQTFHNNAWADLNDGAGGKYIRLVGFYCGCTYGNGGNSGYLQPIIDISTIKDNESAPYGWSKAYTLDNQYSDLNKGCGGKYIYLIFKNSPMSYPGIY